MSTIDELENKLLELKNLLELQNNILELDNNALSNSNKNLRQKYFTLNHNYLNLIKYNNKNNNLFIWKIILALKILSDIFFTYFTLTGCSKNKTNNIYCVLSNSF